MGQPFVESPAGNGQGRRREPKDRPEGLVIPRDQPDLAVAAGKKRPAEQSVTMGEGDEPSEGLRIVGPRPCPVARGVTRQSGDRMVIGKDPYGDILPAETARDGETAMRAAQHERAGSVNFAGTPLRGDSGDRRVKQDQSPDFKAELGSRY